jgi:hypothetical protein
MAKKPANIEEDLLGGTATETAAPPAKPKPKKKVTKPAAEEEEDLIGKTVQKAKASASKVAKPAAAKTNGKAKAAKPEKVTKRVVRAPRDDEQIEKVKAALLKQKKPISYADFATKLDAPIRMVRRMSRALVAEGQLELTKEGTIGYVRSIALA